MPQSIVKFPRDFFLRANLLCPLLDGQSAYMNGVDTTRSQALNAVDVLAENQTFVFF
jgi:hypothetical protein